MKRLTTLLYLGTLLAVPLTTLTLTAPPTAAGELVAQISPEQVQQRAASITVKVLAGERSGSGVIIKRDGDTYSVLTNRHVVESGGPLRVQTADGEVYQNVEAVSLPALENRDLAILEFAATAEYATAPLANLSELRGEEEVFAAGYPFAANPTDAGGLAVTGGRLLLLPEQELKEGYRLGYEGDIEKGMSGGPIFNGEGEVVGINGIHAYPLWGDPYIFEDGSKPTAEQREVMSRLNWGIPIQTLAELVPGYVALTAAPVAATPIEDAMLPLSYDVERVAEKITVLIRWGSGNGSGVIVARRGDVYYVLTAEHVVRNKMEFEIVTHDGERHRVRVSGKNLKTLPGVDLAVVQFESSADYPVATVADYNLASGNDKGFVFASGWGAVAGDEPERRFSAGRIYSRELGRLQGQTSNSFSYGYGLIYTNLTAGGMSGGPVLDSQGRLVAIHGRADGETQVDETSSTAGGVVYLGYSLGVPIRSFLSSAASLGVKRDWLEVKSDPPQSPLEADISAIREQELAAVGKPEECRDAVECVNYGNQLWRLEREQEALVALHRATEMQPGFYAAWYAKGLVFYSKEQYEEAVLAFERATQAKGASSEQLAAAWRWHGDALDWLKRYEEGLASAERAIALDPRDFSSYWLKGSLLYKLKRYEEAIAAYTKAIEIEPHSWAYSNRGTLRRSLEQPKGAIADYDRALDLNPDYATVYNNRGNARRDLGDLQGAVADFDRAIELDSDHAGAYNNRGLARSDLGDHQGAIADYNRALDLNPDYADTYFNRGNARRSLGDYQGAVADYNRAIELDSDYADAYNNRGVARSDLGDYRGAMADYDRVLDLNPDDAGAYNNRGNARYDLGDLQGAMADYDRAIDLNPDDADAYNNRGNARNNLGDYQGAIADFDSGLDLNPDDATLYYNRGVARYYLEDLQGAIADLDSALDLNPDYADAYNNRGSARRNLGDPEGAIADYNRVLELNPDYATAYNNRGNARRDLGDLRAAMADFSKAIELNPDHADAYNNRGLARYDLEDYQGAIADYNKAIKLNPDDATAYFNRGDAYDEQGDYQQAIEDYTRAISLKSDYAIAYRYRGITRERLGNYEGAIADYSKAIELNPDDTSAYWPLALIYHQQGDYSKALADYNRILAIDENFWPAVVQIGLIKYERGEIGAAIQHWQQAVAIESQAAEPQLALAVGMYAQGEPNALAMAEAALELDSSWGDAEFLRENLWGEKLVADAQKLLETPQIRALLSQLR